MQSHNSDIIKRMCELGARPPIIQSCFRDIQTKTIRQIWKNTTGKELVRGQLPMATHRYFSFHLAVRSSLVAKVYADSIAAGASEAEAMICAFELLHAIYGDRADMDFSEVWHISRCVSVGKFFFLNCDHGHTYIADRDSGLTQHPCPVCKEMVKLELKLARQEKEAALRAIPAFKDKKRRCARL